MKNSNSKSTSFVKSFFQKRLFSIWRAFHCLIFVCFVLSLVIFRGKIHLDSDLFNLLPENASAESVKKADKKMTAMTSQNAFILVSDKDFAQAKKSAEQVYNGLLSSDYYDSVVLYNDAFSMSEVTDFLFKYRWNFLDADKFSDKNFTDDFALNALSKAYGGITMLPLDNLEQDPFLLTEYNLQNYLDAVQKSGTAMSLKDGVLAREKDGIWYVMIRVVFSKKGAKLASKQNGVTKIYEVCNALKTDSTDFVFSGTPFHSHESSTSSSREISIIGTVSLLVAVLILLFVFRSAKPLFYSLFAITLSVAAAFFATLWVFGKMHVITLVFGTSLIGSCIDYTLHYFVNWAGNKTVADGNQIREKLFPSLSMAIISTGICFALLLFAPFAILKQMAFFCLTGLLSSYLTTIAVFPKIKMPLKSREICGVKAFSKISGAVQKRRIGRTVIVLIFAFSSILLFVNFKNVGIKNNLLSLYKMKGKLLQDEITASGVIQYNPSGWFIISGNSEQDVLENEENFRRVYEDKFGTQGNYLCTTLFVPSKINQRISRFVGASLLKNAKYQFENLGYSVPEARKLARDLQDSFENSDDDLVSFEDGTVPKFLEDAVKSVWLGNIDGKYYSVLLPSDPYNYDEKSILAEATPDVYFINKTVQISWNLDNLTAMMLKFFALAFVIILIMLKFFYSWKQTLKILSVPLLVILVVASVFATLGIHLEFFSVTGLILVFGLGLDYIIYMTEAEKAPADCENGLENFATMLSFLTTIISFGALALSRFQPVHLMGLSIFTGLSTAYVVSFFYGREKNEKK